ncbi:MAG: transposase [Candidatus Thiodiazotropha sp.]
MSNYRRARMPGGIYFFTVVTHHRKPLFASKHARSCLRHAMAEVKARHPFEVEAICLLPDHLHTIWQLPAGDRDYSQRWNEIKGICAKLFRDDTGIKDRLSLSRQSKGETNFWQRRFWEHLIQNADDYRNHLDYLYFNPVKHGCVGAVVDWPWSSFHRHVREGVYPADWGGSVPGRMNLATVGE